MMIQVTTKATVSLAGNAAQTPSTPMTGGSMMSSGRRKIICRDNERKMLILALPIDWKKLVMTACEPINGNTSMLMRMPRTAFSISS